MWECVEASLRSFYTDKAECLWEIFIFVPLQFFATYAFLLPHVHSLYKSLSSEASLGRHKWRARVALPEQSAPTTDGGSHCPLSLFVRGWGVGSFIKIIERSFPFKFQYSSLSLSFLISLSSVSLSISLTSLPSLSINPSCPSFTHFSLNKEALHVTKRASIRRASIKIYFSFSPPYGLAQAFSEAPSGELASKYVP